MNKLLPIVSQIALMLVTFSKNASVQNETYGWQNIVGSTRWNAGMKYIFCLLLFTVHFTNAFADDCFTQKNGRWSDNTVWSCNRIPTNRDKVIISHDITLDANISPAGITMNSGSLKEDAGARTITIQNDNFIINGTLVVSYLTIRGRQANFNSNSVVTIKEKYTQDQGGLQINQNFTAGEMDIKGTLVQINANGLLNVGKNVSMEGSSFEVNGNFNIAGNLNTSDTNVSMTSSAGITKAYVGGNWNVSRGTHNLDNTQFLINGDWKNTNNPTYNGNGLFTINGCGTYDNTVNGKFMNNVRYCLKNVRCSDTQLYYNPVNNLNKNVCYQERSLPVTLIYFKATPAGNAVVLAWATAKEAHNKTYILERSTNGISFATIHTTSGAGNSDELKRYNYTYTESFKGNVYYRLAWVDDLGKVEYAKVITVDTEGSAPQVQVYPNPSSGNALHIMTINGSQLVLKSVSDLFGKTVGYQQRNAAESLQVNFAQPLPAGFYVATLLSSDSGELVKVKFVVQ